MQRPSRRDTNDLGDSESGNEFLGSEPAESDAEQGNHPDDSNGALFTDESNHPINFFIHDSVKKADTIEKLTSDITQHGGRVVDDVENASIVLVARRPQLRKDLQHSYEAAQDANLHRIYVKMTPFVMKCIELRQVYLYDEEIKPMRGFPPGRKRNDFTAEEDQRLCHYLSRVAPQKAAGGRMGHNIYKNLVKSGEVNPKYFAWARAHPYDSWRGRYKKNQAKMDPIIDQMVEDDPPTVKQIWKEDRRLNKNKRRRIRHVEYTDSEEDIPEEEEAGDEEEGDEEDDDDEVIQQLMVTEPVEKGSRSKSRQSHHQGPASKKARMTLDHGPSNTQKPKSAKGKERVYEETVIEATSPFGLADDDEDGPVPSGRTLVSGHTQQGPPPSSNFFTQNTLVSDPDPDGLPASTPWSPVQPHAVVHTNQANISTKSAPSLGNQVRETVNATAATPSEPKRSSLPTQPTNTAYQRPRMAARRPKNFIRVPVTDDPEPSANTDPKSPQLPPASSPRKRKAIEEEIVNDSDSDSDVEQHPPPSSPALNELFLEDDNEDDDLNQDLERDERATSMDTDDAETKKNLSGQLKASTPLDTDPSEILKRLQAESINLRGSSRPSLRPSPAFVSRTPRSSLHTPKNVLVTPRQWDTASNASSTTESFPPSGTKASAMKKRLQQHEKTTPYNPPVGTRAEMLARQPLGRDAL